MTFTLSDMRSILSSRTNLRPCVSLLLVLCLAALGDEGRARVVVHVADSYGNSVQAHMITLASEDGSKIDVKQDEELELKYGWYTAEVRVPGFSTAVEDFRVNEPDQVLTVALKVGGIEGPAPVCSLDGRVLPAGGAVRIRILQLFGTYGADVPVLAGGTFRFENLDCGEYMLIAMGPRGCLGTKMVRTTLKGTHVDMRLADLGGGACAADK